MKKPSILLSLVACGFLLAIFFVPIWHIKLDAPQYPGGLDMYIWVDKITGTDEFTLQNINILNHYVGMRAIQPDSFKELDIMPYFVAAFIALGLVVALVNKKKLTVAWVSVMIICGAIGLVDFYLWQQDFGHNLDPQAPIKMEGMSYSPPFIGVKKLLNITATSYPDWGAIFFGVALSMALLSIFFTSKQHKATAPSKLYMATAMTLLLFFTACEPKPVTIAYGFDACHHCKMTIADNRFGSQLVTDKGKAYKFDAIECMAQYMEGANESYAYVLVTDLPTPEKFIDAETAVFVQSKALPSPMGMNLSAYENESEANEVLQNVEGSLLTWEEVKGLGHVVH